MTEDEAVREVIAAWVIEGISPEYHNGRKSQLRLEWPSLAKALDKLVVATLGSTHDHID